VTDPAPVAAVEHTAVEGPLEWSPVRKERARTIANLVSAVVLLAIVAMGIAYANAGMP